MLVFIAELILLGGFVSFLTYYVFLLPPKNPANVPTVPFWVALIPLFKDVDQSEIFRQYMEQPLRTHGAVKFFFGAQWNILVHRPSYIAEIFRNEDLYQKSGNQKKIPYSSIVKPGLQREFDADAIARNARRLCELLREAQLRAGSDGVAVQELLQRYSVANCSEVVLETNVDALGSAHAPINLLQSAVKSEIFKPVFMNFPFLDRLPIPSRARARQKVGSFKRELRRALVESRKHGNLDRGSSRSMEGLGSRMLDACESGQWDEKQLLDNLTVAFVAGQENPQLCMISTLYLLAKHPEAQARLWTGIRTRAGLDQHHLGSETWQDMPYLTSVIYESLRLFPPIGQLVNRRASADALLGGEIVVPKGTYLGYNCYSTNRDRAAWGARADDFDPSRWGDSFTAIQKHYRLRRSRAEFISFHGGRRACLGEKFAVLQMRITLVTLVREFAWSLDPSWVDRKTPAGPLYPRALRLVFTSRQKDSS